MPDQYTQGHVRDGALLVDVGEPSEAEAVAFDVPNIVNIPISQLEQPWSELPRDRQLVMVYHYAQARKQHTKNATTHGEYRPRHNGFVQRNHCYTGSALRRVIAPNNSSIKTY